MTAENSPYREIATVSPPNIKETIEQEVERARNNRLLKERFVKTKEQVKQERMEALVDKAIAHLPENIKLNLEKRGKVYLESPGHLFNHRFVVKNEYDPLWIMASKKINELGITARRPERTFPWISGHWILLDFAPSSSAYY